MPWFIYNNYGYESKPKQLLLEAYQSGSMMKPRYIKTIAITDTIKNFGSPHLPNLHNNDYDQPLKRVNYQRQKTLPSGIPNITINKFWINGCHKDEMKEVPIKTIVINKKLINTITITTNNTYNDLNTVLLDNTTTIFIPSTEIFLKHYKYLSWDEYKGQRAGTTSSLLLSITTITINTIKVPLLYLMAELTTGLRTLVKIGKLVITLYTMKNMLLILLVIVVVMIIITTKRHT